MKKTLKHLILTVTMLISISQVKSQNIEVGQSAEEIKTLIEWSTKNHNEPGSDGNRLSSHWTCNVKYFNGQIVDVIQCYQNQPLIDLKVVANYCKHYIMKNNKLSIVLSEFENISIEKLKTNYAINYGNKKIGELYFSDDFEHYSKIYLSNSGIATIEWRKTIISELPLSIRQIVNSKLTSQRLETKIETKKELNETITQEELDKQERLYTILNCNDFTEGLALVCIDSEIKAGEMNYGYGEKLYGYINEKGQYVILPKYEKAFSFNNGYALVSSNPQKSSNWEFINIKGENVFNAKYANAKSFSEGFAAVHLENGSYGYINKNGNFISKPQYQEASDFKEGLARVKYQGNWGFIDTTGKEVIYPQFISERDYSEGLALVSKSMNQYSYIDKSGNIIITLTGDYSPCFKIDVSSYSTKIDTKMEIPLCDFSKGLVVVNKRGVGHVYMDKIGKVILNPPNKKRFNELRPYHFVNEYAIVMGGSTSSYLPGYGLLNKKGEWVVEPLYEDIGNLHEGLVRVKLNNNWGFIDITGKVVINKEILKSKSEVITSPPFDYVSDFSEGLAIVQTRQLFGYIDKMGNWVIKPELSSVSPFTNGVARVKFPDRKGWNFIDKTGKILFTNFL